MLYFGVHPYVLDMAAKDEVQKEAILKGITELEVKKLVKKGDKLIIIHGDKWNQEGATSTVKVVTVV
jgi:pyruvate kinase